LKQEAETLILKMRMIGEPRHEKSERIDKLRSPTRLVALRNH
jgi:hypothetical protein